MSYSLTGEEKECTNCIQPEIYVIIQTTLLYLLCHFCRSVVQSQPNHCLLSTYLLTYYIYENKFLNTLLRCTYVPFV